MTVQSSRLMLITDECGGDDERGGEYAPPSHLSTAVTVPQLRGNS